ncbi:MAG: FG-GAP-like repeat-containing protein [Bacteroidota bacterium]
MKQIYYLSLFLILSLLPGLVISQVFIDMTTPNDFDVKGQNRGVAIADFNNDGWEDIYISSLSGPNLLYENKGNFEFEEVGERFGLDSSEPTYASLWFDMDNDGDQDLFLVNFFKPNILFRNEGDSFTDVSKAYGIESSGNPKSILTIDYDQDGYLDVYIAQSLLSNILWRNEGGKGFRDVTAEARIRDIGRSLGAVALDYDLDGDQDLFQTRDGIDKNLLFQNNGDGSFSEISAELALDFDGLGMGADIADLNGDLYPDIYLTNLFENKLYISQPGQAYLEQSERAGVDDIGMGWSTFFFDCNNDGRQDIYLANDSRFGVNGISPIPNRMYVNQGDIQFSSGSDFGAEQNVLASFGAAAADFDQDGRLDIVISNNGRLDGNQLFRNGSPAANYIAFECRGFRSNRDAIGTRVVLFAGDKLLTDFVRAGSGFVSQGSKRLHFGLGNTAKVDSIQIFWPSGIKQVVRNPEVNKLNRIEEKIATPIDGISEKSIYLFPNPLEVGSQLSLMTNFGESIQAVGLYTLEGKEFPLIAEMRGSEFLLELPANLTPGIYLIKLLSGDRVISEKIFLK